MKSVHLHSSKTSYDGRELVRTLEVGFVGKASEHAAVFEAAHQYSADIDVLIYSHPLETKVDYGRIYSFYIDVDVDTHGVLDNLKAAASAAKA